MPVRQQLEEAVSAPPLNHGGYLWWLTHAGNLYRLSPAGKRTLVEVLGDEFAGASIELVPQRTVAEGAESVTRPLGSSVGQTSSQHRVLIAVASARHLVLLDPALAGSSIAERMRRYALPDGLKLLMDPDALTSVACDHGRVALLAQSEDGETVLAVRAIAPDADWERVVIPEAAVAGPVCLEDGFAVYGSRTLYLLRDSGLSMHGFPDGFSALVPNAVWQIAKPWRRSPFFSLPGGALIPGQLEQGRNQTPQAAYLYTACRAGLPTLSKVQVPSGGMPSEACGNKVAFASAGHLRELDQAVMTTLASDSQIEALPCAITPRLQAAYFDIPLRFREIRVWPSEQLHFAIDSAEILPVGLHFCHNWLVSTGLEGGLPVIHAWSLT